MVCTSFKAFYFKNLAIILQRLVQSFLTFHMVLRGSDSLSGFIKVPIRAFSGKKTLLILVSLGFAVDLSSKPIIISLTRPILYFG